MQLNNTVTLFGTITKAPSTRVSKNGRNYTSFGFAVRPAPDQPLFFYNVVAFGRQATFAQQLAKSTRVKLVATAHGQPENNASTPLLTATFVRPVTPASKPA
jgi:single-stranded DNA-binding protein